MGLFFSGTIFVHLISCDSEKKEDPSHQLATIIDSVYNFQTFDWDDYPLGKYDDEVYRQDAEYAEQQLERLDSITTENLSETELISLELLKFTLKN